MHNTYPLQHQISQAETAPTPADLVLGLSHIALGEIAPATVITVGSKSYDTTLPAGLNPFEEPKLYADPIDAHLLPRLMDDLPVGTRIISGTREVTDDLFGEPTSPDTFTREITVLETDKGKVIPLESLGNQINWGLQPGTETLMTDLGYVIGEVGIVAIPTPETIVAAAALLGVEVKLFPEHEYIPGRLYLEAFAEGKQPVSTGASTTYKHDIEDDHMTAAVLGGEELKAALQEAAQLALAHNDPDVDDRVSQSVDAFTATLRAVIAPHDQLLGEAYGIDMGRRTLVNAGLQMGIPAETSNVILTASQRRGRDLGLPVTKLV
jgi:hypothetical protein